jgi:hypothetical protein
MGRMEVTCVKGRPVRVKSPIVITETTTGGTMAMATASHRRSASQRRTGHHRERDPQVDAAVADRLPVERVVHHPIPA